MVAIKLAFVGAGQVNFGGGEGPWNHVKRLEHMVVTMNEFPLEVVGICDPLRKQAEAVLEVRRSNPDTRTKKMWETTQIFTNLVEMLDTVTPHCVFIGVPPAYHGCSIAPYNLEIECAKRGVHMFVEKPLSCHPASEVDIVNEHLLEATKRGLIVSVGYMFRYSAAVLKMKQLIQEFGEIRAFNARYLCAYSPIDKPTWWDVDRSGGPIVEQGTHFCDLARFLGGEVDLDTLQATSIKQTDKAGSLSSIPLNINEEALAPEKRVPRVTTAFWKFKSGAIGSFMHGVLLHELKYETELEVWGDGYKLTLIDPYGKCQLAVRKPHSENTEVLDFGVDDPYFSEDLVFMQAVKHAVQNPHPDTQQQQQQQQRNPFLAGIHSPYEDAVGTYRLTWEIRTKSERSLS